MTTPPNNYSLLRKKTFRHARQAAVTLLSFGMVMFSAHPCKAEEDKDAPELTVKASRAIDKGLQYLLDNQRDDGSWGGNDEGARATAITSLVLMAFMSRAEFPGSGPNGEALTRAKDWLLKQAAASPNGYLGSSMYEHGIATLSLSELWGMTGNKEDDAVIEKALKDAVDVIVRSQSPAGGWRYQPTPSAGEDTSVTGTVFVGLASARQAGIPIPSETIEKTLLYLESAANKKSGGFVYRPTGAGQQAGVSLGSTAAAAYVAQLLGKRDTEMVEDAIGYLEARTPGIFQGTGYYYYHHYYSIQCMVQAGDDHYAKWYPQIRDALISKQLGDGSWGGGKKEGTKTVGHTTPMAIIILATPHRYIPIYQR